MQDRNSQPFALFGRLGGDRGEPGLVYPVCVGPLGDHRKQCGDAQFGRLLHDEVGGVPLQQGEHQPEVGLRRLLRAGVLGRAAPSRPMAVDPRGEFAVAAVEQPHASRPAPRRMTVPR